MITFRDVLKSNPNILKQYEMLKIDLAINILITGNCIPNQKVILLMKYLKNTNY